MAFPSQSKKCGHPALFSSALISRCQIPATAALRFRQQSEKHTFVDTDTGASVVCFLHPDGRVFVHEINLPALSKR